ncbi:MAG: HlyC/CorC family transporter [Polyangiaceae bacterium]|nr:HlyC/CorC family transporter [Polyangiaceae bacterium]
MSVPLTGLLVAAAAAVLGAAFVATDAALGSLSTARLSALLEQPDLQHRPALERYRNEPAGMRATYTVGRVVCAALTAVVMADVVAPFVPGLLGVVVAVVGTVSFFAPMTDGAVALARQRADKWAPRFATYLRPFEILLWPLAAPLARLTSALTDKLSEPAATAPEVAHSEVEYLVDEVERSGIVGAEPAEMIRNVLEFEDLRARDAMIPRTRVEAIDLATPLEQVRTMVAESGHSRYPVYEGQLDNVIGLLCAKDVFKLEPDEGFDDSTPDVLNDVVRRDIIFVHEHQKLVGLLKEMRHKRQHLAVVVDEFGGTSGIVTLEDIIEEIVGDIRDEHDEAPPAPIQEIGDGRLLANGTLALGDLSAYLGVETPAEVSTVEIGELFHEEDRTPGTLLEKHGITFIAREVTDGKIAQIEVHRRPDTSLRPPPPSSHPPASDKPVSSDKPSSGSGKNDAPSSADVRAASEDA